MFLFLTLLTFLDLLKLSYVDYECVEFVCVPLVELYIKHLWSFKRLLHIVYSLDMYQWFKLSRTVFPLAAKEFELQCRAGGNSRSYSNSFFPAVTQLGYF